MIRKLPLERGVGFRRPPVHSRFKKGQSGNPKGRPRGSENMVLLLRKILNKKVTVREGNKILKLTQFEAMMGNLSVKAMKGEPKAIKLVLELIVRYGLLSPEEIRHTIQVEFV